MLRKNDKFFIKTCIDADNARSIVEIGSSTGYCTFLRGNLIIQRSKKQNIVKRSSVEFEFRTMTQYANYYG